MRVTKRTKMKSHADPMIMTKLFTKKAKRAKMRWKRQSELENE